VSEEGGRVVLHLRIPFADGGEVSIKRHGRELNVGVGPYRRAFVMPDTLTRRRVESAKLTGGTLAVSFAPAESVTTAG
jgi:HSP20 family molecular chaperone IbpA